MCISTACQCKKLCENLTGTTTTGDLRSGWRRGLETRAKRRMACQAVTSSGCHEDDGLAGRPPARWWPGLDERSDVGWHGLGVFAMAVSLTDSHGHPEDGKSVAPQIEKGDGSGWPGQDVRSDGSSGVSGKALQPRPPDTDAGVRRRGSTKQRAISGKQDRMELPEVDVFWRRIVHSQISPRPYIRERDVKISSYTNSVLAD